MNNSLAGNLLVATPLTKDPRFAGSLVYIIAHNLEGATGLVVNRIAGSITFSQLLPQLGLSSKTTNEIRVFFGGPVDTGRGFVLHSPEYKKDSTITIQQDICLTTTIEIIKDIATGKGPKESIVALGYSGWYAGQLENELCANGWFHIPADAKIIFSADNENKWHKAVKNLGFDISKVTLNTSRA